MPSRLRSSDSWVHLTCSVSVDLIDTRLNVGLVDPVGEVLSFFPLSRSYSKDCYFLSLSFLSNFHFWTSGLIVTLLSKLEPEASLIRPSFHTSVRCPMGSMTFPRFNPVFVLNSNSKGAPVANEMNNFDSAKATSEWFKEGSPLRSPAFVDWSSKVELRC